MRRRDFLTLAGITLVADLSSASAQQAGAGKKVGVLFPAGSVLSGSD